LIIGGTNKRICFQEFIHSNQETFDDKISTVSFTDQKKSESIYKKRLHDG